MINNSNHTNREWAKLKSNMFPVKPKIKSKDKRYDLLYRDHVVLGSQPYPVCVAWKNKQVANGTHTKSLFKTKRVK